MYVKLKINQCISLIHLSQFEYVQCPDYPEFNDDVVLHLANEVIIYVKGNVVRDTYEGIILRESLFESNKLPEVIDFTSEAWEGKFECYDAQGNDMLNIPEDQFTKKAKARKRFSIIK